MARSSDFLLLLPLIYQLSVALNALLSLLADFLPFLFMFANKFLNLTFISLLPKCYEGKVVNSKFKKKKGLSNLFPSWFILFISKYSLTDWSWLYASTFKNGHQKYSKETCTTNNTKARTIYKWHNFFIWLSVWTQDRRNFMQFNHLFHPMKYKGDRPVNGNTNISKDKGIFPFSALFHPTILCLSCHLLEAS